MLICQDLIDEMRMKDTSFIFISSTIAVPTIDTTIGSIILQDATLLVNWVRKATKIPRIMTMRVSGRTDNPDILLPNQDDNPDF